MEKRIMIPKIIHLCWFSGEKFPSNIQSCIDSWEKILPDYQVKTWTYQMALDLNIPFVTEALSVKKWAFAADVIRLYALYTEGGIYMDSDIFLKKRFDSFITDNVILFQEYHSTIFKKEKGETFIDKYGVRINPGTVPGIGIQAAFLMAAKGHPLIKSLLDFYLFKHFIDNQGNFFTDPIAPTIYAMQMENIGYKYIDEKQVLDDVTIYESKYVAGSIDEVSNEAFAIHCCAHSWYESTLLEKNKHCCAHSRYESTLLRKIKKKIKHLPKKLFIFANMKENSNNSQ